MKIHSIISDRVKYKSSEREGASRRWYARCD